MRLTKKARSRLFFLMVPALVSVVLLGSAVAQFNVSLMEQIPSITPVQVGTGSFTVYDANYNFLGEVQLGPDGRRYFTDPTHVYPNIDVFFTTNVYDSDSRGNYVADKSQWLSTSLMLGDTLYVLSEGYVSFGYGVRTMTNLPGWRTDTAMMIDPLAGFTIAHAGGSMTLVPTSGTIYDKYIPYGTLLFTVDTGLAGWPVGSMAGSARISQSIEKIDFNNQMHGTPLRPGCTTLAGAKNNLATKYGNSAVIVRPRFTLEANSNLLRFDMNETTTLPNGTVVTTTVKTTSNLVGFESAWEDVPLRQSVLIPHMTEDQFSKTNFDPVEPEVSKTNTVQNDNSNPPVTVASNSGGVRYLRDSSPVGGLLLGQRMNIANAYTSLYGIAPSIDLNAVAAGHLSLPSTLVTYNDFTVQPSTRVKTALTQVYGGVHQYDGLWPDNYDLFTSVSYNLEYPYAFSLQNVAEYNVITTKVAMITANKVTVSSEGVPFNVDDIKDHDLGEIINNPTVDDMVVTETNTNINVWEMLERLFTGATAWLIWIGIGAASVAVIYVVYQFKGKRQG